MRRNILQTLILSLLLALAALLCRQPANAAPGDFLLKIGGQYSFNNPRSVAVDPSGNVYVADDTSIQKFDNSGKSLTRWTTRVSQGFSDQEIAIDGSGNVYLVDENANRVQKFSGSGQLLLQWGSLGTDPGQFSSPKGVAVDQSGNVYVADGARVEVFTGDGQFLRQWGRIGSEPGQFVFPQGITVDSHGFVYVADTGNGRIQKFTNNGVFLMQWGTPGKGNGQFYDPVSVAVDQSGNVYVVDSEFEFGRVQKFDAAGKYLAQWGAYGHNNGDLWGPGCVTTDRYGKIYVADTANERIEIFTSAGTYLSKWANFGNDNGEFYFPKGMALDGSGNVLVCDSLNLRVEEFTATGAFLRTIGAPGSFPGGPLAPYAVATDKNGNIYISDVVNSNIALFTSTGNFVRTMAGSGGGAGTYWYPNGIALDQDGTIYVADTYNSRMLKYDASGNLIAQWGSRGSGEGQFGGEGEGPVGVALDGGANIYVTDPGNYRVQKFSTGGQFLGQWGSQYVGQLGSFGGADGTFCHPQGIASDKSGFVYVTDLYSCNAGVQVFTGSGAFVGKWGPTGSADGQLQTPDGIATDPWGTRVYVVDSGNNRVQLFEGFGSNQVSATHFAVTAPASASAGTAFQFTVTALDANNHKVAGYTGRIHFTSSDRCAALPPDATLSGGVGTFFATLKTAGKQTLTVSDKAAASITGRSGPISVAEPKFPDLTVKKDHRGIFNQGQNGASYTIVVTNSGAAETKGIVTVTDLLPAALTAKSISGNGWSCSLAHLNCTRRDALAPGRSYQPVTVTVTVAKRAPSSVTNTATVSGGGEINTFNDTAKDVTAIR
jgi:uncharacterized repeat protein (TIGR01451 family)